MMKNGPTPRAVDEHISRTSGWSGAVKKMFDEAPTVSHNHDRLKIVFEITLPRIIFF